LKNQYFDVLAAVLWESKKSADAEKRLFQVFPEAERYATRITEVLMKSFDPLNKPLKNYLLFADLNNQNFTELSKRVLNEAAVNKDTFDRLAKDGSVEGHIGLHYVIDMYRRSLLSGR
jgi:DNA helicase HerA-like ATPase